MCDVDFIIVVGRLRDLSALEEQDRNLAQVEVDEMPEKEI